MTKGNTKEQDNGGVPVKPGASKVTSEPESVPENPSAVRKKRLPAFLEFITNAKQEQDKGGVTVEPDAPKGTSEPKPVSEDQPFVRKKGLPVTKTVEAQQSQICRPGIPKQEQKVRSIIVQPNYNSATLFNDVALLVLEHPFQADDNVQLICLPPQGATFTDRNCYAIGWGKSNFDSDSYQVILKKVQLPMVSHPDCQTALRGTRLGGNYRLHNSFVCAGGEAGIDTCTGDGGSPLMCPFSGSETRFYQAGIVSWGIGCGTAGVPDVYAKNSMFTEWINQELQKHRVDGDLFD
nr:phenoloxidase-activating factor 2-like [Aedes albopictus]